MVNNSNGANSESIQDEIRARPDFSKFVAIDIETTGLKASEGEIIELGATRFSGRDEVETFRTLVKPESGFPERNRRLTGIDPVDLEKGRDAKSALEEFREFIGDDLLVSHNAQFDMKFLGHHLEKQNLDPIENQVICTLHLGAVVDPEAGTLQLAKLAEHWGIAVTDPHRALQDARMAGHLAVKLIDEMRSWSREFLSHLAGYRGKSLDAMFDLLDDLAGDEDIDGGDWRLSEAVWKRLADPDSDGVLPLLRLAGKPAEGKIGDDKELESVVREAIERGGVTILEDMRPGAGSALGIIKWGMKDHPQDAVDTKDHMQDAYGTVVAVPDESWIGRMLGSDDGGDGYFGGKAVYLGRRSEYICIRRAFGSDGRPVGWLELSPYERVVFARWLAGTRTGRIARVNWWLLNNFSGLKGHLNSLTAGGLECIGLDKPYECPCFTELAQAKAHRASVIIVNQQHLCSKSGSERLLGSANACIVEGASQFTNNARIAESRVLELDSLRRTLSLIAQYNQECDPGIAEVISFASIQLKDLLETCKHVIRAYRANQPRDGSGPIPVDDENWTQDAFIELAGALEATGEKLVKSSRSIKESQEKTREYKAVSHALSNIAETIVLFRKVPPGWAASIEGAPARNPKRVTLRLAPVDVGSVIQRVINEASTGFIAVDRNLRYQGTFDRVISFWGFSPDAQVARHVLEDPSLVLPPLFLPEDITSPTSRTGRRYHWEKYMERTANLLRMLAETLDGRSVAVFSAHHELRRVREILEETPPRDCIVLAQYMDGTKSALIREYLKNPATLLLGGRNFLDGVDLRPVGFTALVLVKLPFVSPEEPVHRAALRSLEGQGIDGMRTYLVPQAADASNRWIDSLVAGPLSEATDPAQPPGAVVILDPRAIRNDWGDDLVSTLNVSPVFELPFREMIGKLGEMV